MLDVGLLLLDEPSLDEEEPSCWLDEEEDEEDADEFNRLNRFVTAANMVIIGVVLALTKIVLSN